MEPKCICGSIYFVCWMNRVDRWSKPMSMRYLFDYRDMDPRCYFCNRYLVVAYPKKAVSIEAR